MLSEQRKKIDQLDQEIVRLLEQRLDCAKEVAEIKKKNQLPILDESREQALLEKIKTLTKNPDYQKYIIEIYETILKTSKDYQKKYTL